MPKHPSDKRPSEAGAKHPRGVGGQTPAALLTTAEEQADVLDRVRKGQVFREIAADLKIAVSTVHRRYIDGRNALPAEMAAHIAAEVVE